MLRNGTVKYIKRWTPESIRPHDDWVVLFGDNLLGQGTGGQACIRGMAQAHGIPTKKEPTMEDDAFFTDEDFGKNCAQIWEAFSRLPIDKLRSGELILVLPEDGLGTGLADLANRAPRTKQYLDDTVAAVVKSVCGLST